MANVANMGNISNTNNTRKINLLDKNVAEMIAAGEVIERPASVIKEIIENSIDAGASSITVEIKNGGISYIRVTDDGCGISFEDLPLAFYRHATSKVKVSEDLDNIMTLGFRGEALASIATVARVEMLTKQACDSIGSDYKIEGGEEILHETAGCPDGTTIIIRDLFYNTPARLKFLKKDVSEGNSVASVVDKLALAHPEVSFKFIRDNKQVRVTVGDGEYYSAIYSVFGKQLACGMIPVDFGQNGVKISGYTSSPLFGRGNRGMQVFFVNGRYIRSTTCIAALEEAYRNSIMVGKFPACVLNISLPASDVDVNVHPAKTEVRFANDKVIFDSVFYSVKNAILNAENSREVVLENTRQAKAQRESEVAAQINVSESEVSDNKNTSFAQYKAAPKKQFVLNSNASPYSSQDFREKKTEQVVIEQGERVNTAQTNDISQPQGLPPEPPIMQSNYQREEEPEMADCFKYLGKKAFVKEGKPVQRESDTITQPKEEKLSVIGEIFKTYIICQCGDNMILMDKHAAHERLRFEKLKKELVQHSQLLAESITVKLTPEEYTALDSFGDSLNEIGMEVLLGQDFTAEITEMPTMFDKADCEKLVLEIADILLKSNSNTKGELFDEILHSMACKSAIKAHDTTDIKELEVLANQVYSDKSIRFCPHGRPIMINLTKYEIEKYFNRV